MAKLNKKLAKGAKSAKPTGQKSAQKNDSLRKKKKRAKTSKERSQDGAKRWASTSAKRPADKLLEGKKWMAPKQKAKPIIPPKPSRGREIVESATVGTVTVKQKKVIPKEQGETVPPTQEIHTTTAPTPDIHTTISETHATSPEELDEEHLPVSKSKVSSVKLQAEALLFSSGKAMEEAVLMSTIGIDKRTLKKALIELKLEYEQRDTALTVFNEGTSWKLLVKDEHIALVRKIVANTELTRATMETLAVIAYQQPEAMQSTVVDIRGGNAYGHIAELEELGFVTKAKKGRSFVLKLTEKFYDYFDIDGATSIRKIFKEVKAPGPEEKQQLLGELEVVDELPASEEKNGAVSVGGLEVVEQLDAQRREKGECETQPEFKPKKLEMDREERNEFLAKLDEQIEQLSHRNDEWSKDDDLKPRTPAEPTTDVAKSTKEEASVDDAESGDDDDERNE